MEWLLDPQSRVLILTSHNSIEDRVTGLNAGADDYLGKPFSFPEMLARVASQKGLHGTLATSHPCSSGFPGGTTAEASETTRPNSNLRQNE